MREPFLNASESEPSYEVMQKPLSFVGQTGLLIRKNLILTIKNPKNLIFLFLTPFILSLFMAVFQSLAQSNASRTLENPEIRVIPDFPTCIGKDCISLEYAIITTEQEKDIDDPQWVKQSINFVKNKAQLSDSTINKYKTPITTLNELKNYHLKYQNEPNITQIGILFCGSAIPSPEFQPELNYFCDGSKDYSYYLLLNKTDSMSVIFHDMMQPLPIDEVAASLKLLVDNSIYNNARNQPDSQQMPIKYTTSQYPVGPNRYIENYDIVSQIGAFYYMITPLFAFLFIQNQIVREKEYKLRQGLNIFGASHAAYWISWFLISNIYSLVGSISTYLSGLVFGFGFFLDTNPVIIIFFLMYPFILAMQMMSFFLSTLSPTLKAANAISYGIVLFAIVVESFVANNTLIQFIFTNDSSGLVEFLKIVLTFYPPFSYTKIFTNITMYSGYHFNMDSRKWEEGLQKYSFKVFSSQSNGLLPFGGGSFTKYSDLGSMFVLFGDALFFIILAWYFDHVVESNRGRGESFFFPFIKIGKLFSSQKSQMRRARKELVEDELRNPKFLLQDEEESTLKEKQRVYKNSASRLPAMGLRIKNLSKTFAKMCSKNRVEAIRNFNLEIEPNELMGVLGHNGAGKTTLINILTGVINPDEAQDLEIIINNKQIQKINEIRKYIGVCSQFDILWNEMTAEEHLFMFAKLKNIPEEAIDSKIDTILGFVNLLSEKKSRVNSFSGGMKRRLSLAIAAIGNPKVIFLDEPTTGLDPKVRQQIWELIEKLKKGKSIILTTHSMQEADILADRLCVMVKGRLKCVGSSLYLKKKYGDGHRVTLNIDDSKSKQVLKTIQKLFPKAIEVDCKGGNMIIGIDDFESMLDLIKMLQNKQSSGLDEYTLKQSIKDWNVSHTTLEQVFMKVTKQSEE